MSTTTPVSTELLLSQTAAEPPIPQHGFDLKLARPFIYKSVSAASVGVGRPSIVPR
ncbi:MAG: hypothetical protein ACJ74W_22850 [Pyrinomonadaceae bacterium]